MHMTGTGRTQFSDSVLWDTITGTAGSDMIEITWGDDTVYAGKGSDYIWDIDGTYQNRHMGSGGDHIWLASNDKIYGGDGDDHVFAGWGADTIYGGSGWDTVDYGYSQFAIVLDLTTGIGTGATDFGVHWRPGLRGRGNPRQPLWRHHQGHQRRTADRWRRGRRLSARRQWRVVPVWRRRQ